MRMALASLDQRHFPRMKGISGDAEGEREQEGQQPQRGANHGANRRLFLSSRSFCLYLARRKPASTDASTRNKVPTKTPHIGIWILGRFIKRTSFGKRRLADVAWGFGSV